VGGSKGLTGTGFPGARKPQRIDNAKKGKPFFRFGDFLKKKGAFGCTLAFQQDQRGGSSAEREENPSEKKKRKLKQKHTMRVNRLIEGAQTEKTGEGANSKSSSHMGKDITEGEKEATP